MKKIITIVAAGLLLVALSAVGFAAKDKGPYGKRQFSPQKRSETVEYMTEKNRITKDYLQAQVNAGVLSQQVADARIVIMKDRLDKFKAGRPQFSAEQILASQAAKQDYRQKLYALKTDSVKKAMLNGSISQEQGERILRKMEDKQLKKDRDRSFKGRYGGKRYDYGKRIDD